MAVAPVPQARSHAPFFLVIFFNGGFILVSDYVRMEVTLVGASWDVVAGDRDGCGLRVQVKIKSH